MKVLLDSSAWIEILGDSPRADKFMKALDNLDNLVVPTICLAEVHRFVARNDGEAKAAETASAMQQGHVLPLSADLALLASELGKAHRLALADSVIYASARATGAQLWTQDADYKDLPGVRYFSKKD